MNLSGFRLLKKCLSRPGSTYMGIFGMSSLYALKE
jgi:hypothetical protein